jgi:deferrochelatase/peroxidase EfeB
VFATRDKTWPGRFGTPEDRHTVRLGRPSQGASDAFNEYITHIGSAIFAIPPGLRRGQHWGDDLLAT